MKREELTDIKEVAAKLNLRANELQQYGTFAAKIAYDWQQDNLPEAGKLILLTATSPTPAGEGKTTTAIGLIDALAKLHKNVCGALREPSMGPTFGLKGGACGGGKAQVLPAEDINLHFTGDLAAITQANNLLAACLDNHIYWGNSLQIDPQRILLKRALDMNDRSLRNFTYTIKQPATVLNAQTYVINGSYTITAASELLAIFGLAKDFADLRYRLDHMVLAYNFAGEPVYARQLKITDALLTILQTAFNPNLVQTAEHNPVLLHGGAFANIANGTNTLVSTKLALRLADYVVTEAGFGSDLGLEKYCDLLAAPNNLHLAAVVLVSSLRALKYQAGIKPDDWQKINLEAVRKGFANLQRHIEIVRTFKRNPYVCLNVFPDDNMEEINYLQSLLQERGIKLYISHVYAAGGEGILPLARDLCCDLEKNPSCNTYNLQAETSDFKERIELIAKKLYGAAAVEFSEQAQVDIAAITRQGWQNLPVCIAKTPLSFTDNAKNLNAPQNFVLTVTSLKPYTGAGFIVAACGKILTLPGLPADPAACHMRCL